MPTILEYDVDRAYATVADKKTLDLEDYLAQPLLLWCHKNIGPIKWPREPAEIMHGDGWEIAVDWNKWMLNHSNKPEACVIINKDIDPQLLTDFWMRFQ